MKIAGDLSSDIIKSTLVPNVEEGSSFFVSPIFFMAVAIILLSPFNYYRTLNALGYISAFGLFAVGIIIFLDFSFIFSIPPQRCCRVCIYLAGRYAYWRLDKME